MGDIDIRIFYDFLDEHRVKEEGIKITHTSFGKPFGKFLIEENQKFLNLYKKVVNIVDLHIIERPKKVGSLVLDFDFKFSEDKDVRQYTKDDIYEVVKRLNDIFMTYIEFSTDNIYDEYEIFVFEKDLPTHYKDREEYKDGFHLLIPIPLTMEMRYFIFEELKKRLVEDKVFEHLCCKNDINDICDSSVIYNNGWLMYGSRKKDGKKYDLTMIFDSELNNVDLGKYDADERVVLFSIRKYEDGDEAQLKETYNNVSFKEKIDEMISKYIKVKRNATIVKPKSYMEIPTEPMVPAKFKLIYDLVNILSPKRADEYNMWIRVGWALRNIDYTLLPVFIDFSKKCPKKFSEDSCNKIWYSAKTSNEGLTIASIYWWAKQDNFAEYCRVIRSTINDKIRYMESGTHDDIAKVLLDIYQHEYKCVALKKRLWYQFDRHRWIQIESAYTLQNRIAEEITTELATLCSIEYEDFAKKNGFISQEQLNDKNSKIKQMGALIGKLKSQDFLNKIIERAGCRFYDSKFEENLDSNPYLLGFNNGVYDLRSGCFRDGTPDDLVSFTTGYDYIDFEGTEPVFDEINDYFLKVQRDEKMREYVLRLISSFLDGTNREQKFVIWTGSGCHTLDTGIRMYNGSIKKVQNVVVGDEIMGDDYTKRTVLRLFRGNDTIYRIQYSDGTFYDVNKDHRLAVASTYKSIINYVYNLDRYEVIWHKLVNGIPYAETRYFRTFENASYFLNQESLTASFIKHSMIIPIMVKDFIKLDDSIKCYYRCIKSEVNRNILYTFTITQMGIDNYYGFEIDGNSRYLLENNCITYNSNGKSSTIELIKLTFGCDYFSTVPITILTRKRGSAGAATPELADKKGKRILMLQEPEHDDELNVGFMKELTGGDSIYARQLYATPFAFKPQFKLLLTCNKLPKIPSTDGGTWRRLRVAPWRTEFVEGVPKTSNQFKMDKLLSTKMIGWKQAFMWLLLNKYYKQYIKEGMNEPEDVLDETNKYKKDSDIIYDFISDECIITKNEDDKIYISELYIAFKDWCKIHCDSKTTFKRRDLENYFINIKLRVEEKMVYGIKYER